MRLISFVFIIYFAFVITVSAQSESVQEFFKQGMQAANTQDFQTAIESYKKSLSLSETEDSSKIFLAKIHYNIGVCYYQLNFLNEAVKEFTKAVSLSNKTYQKAFYGLGMAETGLKNFDNGKKAFIESIRLNEKDGEAWFDLAVVLTMEREYENAKNAFANAIKHKSISKSASYNNIGVIYALNNDFQSAENQFKLALYESDGKLIEAEKNLQLCRLRLQSQDINLLAELEFSRKEKTNNQEKKWTNNQM
jgi:Flp pilus assembly protein TadD